MAATAIRPAGIAHACGGLLLAFGTIHALLTPELPSVARLATVAIVVLTLWRPGAGLVATIAVAPAGLLLAAPPSRVAELLVWAFLAAWLLRSWRSPATHAPTTPLTAALVFGLCALASWAAYTIATAAGIEPLRLPLHLVRTLDAGHLVFSAPEPETFALLDLLAGLGLFAATAALTRDDPELRRKIATSIMAACAVLGVLTVADVLRQWAEAGYGTWFLLRYARGERFSLHLQDLNATGSQYVLGGLIAAAMAVTNRERRALWLGLLALMVPALYLSGSRAATLGGFLAGGALIPLLSRRIAFRISPAPVFLLLLLGMAVIGGAVAASGGSEQQGTAANSLWIRSQFLVTSARMVASAPIFGVGIGHYHERSNAFMPAALQQIYRHENAHNYFAQQFAEMGLVGGALFAWLVIAGVRSGWTQVWDSPTADPATLALLAGCVGYLLTCVTGHPLLVPEAALPFWGAFGALAATAPAARMRRALVAGVVLVLAFGVVLALRRYSLTDTRPGEQGFYALEKTDDGTSFVWMTRHGVFYEGPQPGTLVVPVRAPDFLGLDAPFTVDVEVAGRRSGSYEVTADRWTTIEIPIRERASGAFRRIDVRADRSWTPRNDRGGGDEGPRSVMVGTTRFTPAGGR